mmetsp:Transcript_19993/g.46527  ORF Transcript_19993/g.46527 Transcript_19993/m.46527 type:complete len:223 (+) Transcript_19993:606-1274(+)
MAAGHVIAASILLSLPAAAWAGLGADLLADNRQFLRLPGQPGFIRLARALALVRPRVVVAELRVTCGTLHACGNVLLEAVWRSPWSNELVAARTFSQSRVGQLHLLLAVLAQEGFAIAAFCQKLLQLLFAGFRSVPVTAAALWGGGADNTDKIIDAQSLDLPFQISPRTPSASTVPRLSASSEDEAVSHSAVHAANRAVESRAPFLRRWSAGSRRLRASGRR